MKGENSPQRHDDGVEAGKADSAAECHRECQLESCCDQQVHKRQGKQELPAQIKQLVNPNPRRSSNATGSQRKPVSRPSGWSS